MGEPKLPVHGFVLAGGKSRRMGEDKALMRFCGRPMVEIAVEKLRGFCAEVSIAGNRDDLAGYAPVVHDRRVDAGPAAGVEAGLLAARKSWVLFIPVDVPLIPMELLRAWATSALAREASGLRVSQLVGSGRLQPAFCLLRRDCLTSVSASLDGGERRLRTVLLQAQDRIGDGFGWEQDASGLAFEGNPTASEMELWFCNVNTPHELAEAEAWALQD